MSDFQVDRWTRLRARFNHIAVTRFGPVARAVTRLLTRYPDSSLSRLYNRWWLSAPVFTLTVRGRKSGQPRSVSLILTRQDDDIIVSGSNAGSAQVPAWFLNLRAAGEATAEVDGDWWRVSFREVDDPAEAAACREKIAAVYPGIDVYSAHTDREFPVGVLAPLR